MRKWPVDGAARRQGADVEFRPEPPMSDQGSSKVVAVVAWSLTLLSGSYVSLWETLSFLFKYFAVLGRFLSKVGTRTPFEGI